MKRTRTRRAALFLAVVLWGCVGVPVERDTLFQTSTIDALLAGDYDGDMSFGRLKRRGDLGLGTLNGLDGEMVAVDGRFYQVRTDGVAYPVPDRTRTPYAVVTFFDSDRTLAVDTPTDLDGIHALLDRLAPPGGLPFAIRAEGRFARVKTRSVPRQTPPYRRLAEVVREQVVFDLRDVRGTLVGFWCPAALEGLSVPGYHLHFLTEDRRAGGHVLGCEMTEGELHVDVSPAFHVVLPSSGAAGQGPRMDELDRVERGAR